MPTLELSQRLVNEMERIREVITNGGADMGTILGVFVTVKNIAIANDLNEESLHRTYSWACECEEQLENRGGPGWTRYTQDYLGGDASQTLRNRGFEPLLEEINKDRALLNRPPLQL